jgi:hypothetical protein
VLTFCQVAFCFVFISFSFQWELSVRVHSELVDYINLFEVSQLCCAIYQQQSEGHDFNVFGPDCALDHLCLIFMCCRATRSTRSSGGSGGSGGWGVNLSLLRRRSNE